MVDILARCTRHPIDLGVWPDPIHHWHYTDHTLTPWPALNTRRRSLTSHEVQAGAAGPGRGHQKAMRGMKCKVFEMFFILCYVLPNKSLAAILSFIAWPCLNTLAHDPSITTSAPSTPVFLEDLQVLELLPVNHFSHCPTHCLPLLPTNHSA
jgi:hypothetical protein